MIIKIDNIKHTKTIQVISLSIFIALTWCWVYGRFSWFSWQTPITYGGDAWLDLAVAKTFLDGDVFPFIYKSVAHLGAPLSGNWNDYPIEELIFIIMGWLGKFTGLFVAANFVLFLAHLLAGLSFWFVSKELKYRSAFAFSGAILFAFSHFIFARSAPHIVLSYYWHVPLILLVSWWTYSEQQILNYTRQWKISVFVAIISGLLNPYYAWIFLQFMGFAVLMHLVRKQYTLMVFPLVLVGFTVAGFLVSNLDNLCYSVIHGKNIEAVSRSLAGLEVFGLKLPELIYPPGNHLWKSWAEYGQNHYFIPTLIKGESGSPYLGLVGIVGLVWLSGLTLYRILQGRAQLIPVHAWQTLWIILYSLIGGLNLLLGTLGLVLFRGTNRFSIVILALVLLFLVRQLSRYCPEKWILPMAFCIVALGLWDQLPPRTTSAQIQQGSVVVKADRDFAISLESNLRNGAMVFQLPVADFPEIPPIVKMADYEHFRPYLFTQNLRYSYGTNKGRGDADWQKHIEKLSPIDMIRKLESYGFGAIMINRNGYLDRGKALIEGFISAGRIVISDSNDLIAFGLQPMANPVAIESFPIFGAGWSGDELTHRWSESSHTNIMLNNNDKIPHAYDIGFNLSALTARAIRISLNGINVSTINTIPGQQAVFPLTKFILTPGKNTLSFDTESDPVSPNNGDPRMLSFNLSDFQFKTEGG